ncbi:MULTISPECIES: hypothetical protein [Amycolatopsis]|uniref:Uncharacterized protein n=2 Tax=Amycolatopsis TaxID=1813 RepID=A0A1I3NMP1_9PSEU|nr:hypothetical protein [Amycolatopsis sacchari]SFJ10459.1 hypothetical protein SAMN05421835_10387 [Amycolatopsis sacchari]
MDDEFLRSVRQWLVRAELRRMEQALEQDEPLIPLPRTPQD